jgi:Winged helix-turn helix
MSHDDVLFGYRLRLFTLAEELRNVSEACRRMGVSRQTYYRLKRQMDRWGLEALRVRERRRPRQPNEIGPHLEQRIVAFSLAHPGFGPRRISAELARENRGRPAHLRARRLARALPRGAEHQGQAPGADRPSPRSL